jgi:hypothetical protein
LFRDYRPEHAAHHLTPQVDRFFIRDFFAFCEEKSCSYFVISPGEVAFAEV